MRNEHYFENSFFDHSSSDDYEISYDILIIMYRIRITVVTGKRG